MGGAEDPGPPGGVTRRPVAAGSFYPAGPDELARTVDALLAGAPPRRGTTEPARAVVVPHAGYGYSGPIAATGYASALGPTVARVAVLGPSHFEPIAGVAVSAAGGWETPLGEVPVDERLRRVALEAGATADERAHAADHALEVQLPFLQRAFGDGISVLPLAVGVSSPDAVADLLERLWDVAELVVVSTDLSHYLNDATARSVDRHTAQRVVEREPTAIADSAACGVFALRGVVALARRRDLPIRLLALGTSADASDDPRRVVGYGAFAIG